MCLNDFWGYFLLIHNPLSKHPMQSLLVVCAKLSYLWSLFLSWYFWLWSSVLLPSIECWYSPETWFACNYAISLL